MNMRSVNLLLLVLLFAVVLPIPSILAAATSKEVDAAKETNRNPYETNANAMPENLEAADKQSNSQVGDEKYGGGGHWGGGGGGHGGGGHWGGGGGGHGGGGHWGGGGGGHGGGGHWGGGGGQGRGGGGGGK
ncbi:cold and drought-regulated protein CORA-like isoform X1 [Citrus sinensis]|uniref:cold and drought-regulated protein CORA-like n=1 Tax=Citrus clementina TaxID=85681 RepID=UPI000CED7AEC|nr:cold and drought-regulated protein CORA-like [Citrus x clementina]XP_024950365.1 cold and drought-regulated protein CORA-like isoform X1 [Citrus sinensis]